LRNSRDLDISENPVSTGVGSGRFAHFPSDSHVCFPGLPLIPCLSQGKPSTNTRLLIHSSNNSCTSPHRNLGQHRYLTFLWLRPSACAPDSATLDYITTISPQTSFFPPPSYLGPKEHPEPNKHRLLRVPPAAIPRSSRRSNSRLLLSVRLIVSSMALVALTAASVTQPIHY
jgi:hypothetical protein